MKRGIIIKNGKRGQTKNSGKSNELCSDTGKRKAREEIEVWAGVEGCEMQRVERIEMEHGRSGRQKPSFCLDRARVSVSVDN